MTSNTTISRRRIIQGTAWTVPVVAATAAAPAFAASPSKCKPTISWGGDLDYTWGEVGSTSTTQKLVVGGQTYINNLPPGVSVTSITYNIWIANRDGQDNPGQGTAFWMGNKTSDKVSACGTSGCSASWTPTAGSGFVPIVTNTKNLVNQKFPDGATRKSWDLNMSWDPARDSNIKSRYTAGTGVCKNFTTGPSSKFTVTYTGVVGPTAAGWKAPFAFVVVTAKLDNGQTLSLTYQTA